jgi:hypothetical protein
VSRWNEFNPRNLIRMTKPIWSSSLPVILYCNYFTLKTGVSLRHLLRLRNSASTTVISTLKSVCLRVKTTLLSVKTTLRLSYRELEMTLLSASIKSYSKVSKRHPKCHFQHSIRKTECRKCWKDTCRGTVCVP